MNTFLSRHKFFLLLIVAFAIMRLPSLFEGFWYVDEGFYAAQAETILRGKELYLEGWDHKPPLMVWIYLLGGFFGWNLGYPLIKFFSIVIGVASLYLIRELFVRENVKPRVQIALLVVAVLLLGTPILEGNLANTELFFLPITVSVLYLSLYRTKAWWVGLLLALAFLIKPQAFLESVSVVTLVGIYDQILERKSLPPSLRFKYYATVILSFLVVILSYFLFLFAQGAHQEFIDAVFITNFVYIESEDGAVFWNIIKLISAGLVFLWLLWRTNLRKLNRTEFVVFSLVVANTFLISLSGRPYPHYLIQLIPSMLFAFGLLTKKKDFSIKRCLSVAVAFLVVVLLFFSRGVDVSLLDRDRLKLQLQYYIDFPSYLAGDHSTDSWYWKNHSSSDWTREFIDHFEQNYSGLDYYYYGEQPWIFTQLEGNFVNKYYVWYHLDYSEEKMKEGIDASNQAMIVVVDEYSRRKRPQFFENLERNFTLLEKLHNYTIYANNEY